jgi:hypothetical protein
MPSTNGWNRYQKLVLFRLDEQDQKLTEIAAKVDALRQFKMRVIGWSSALAFISSGAMAFFWSR